MKKLFKHSFFNIRNIYTILLIFLLICICITIIVHPTKTIYSYSDKYIDFSNNWIDNEGNKITLQPITKNKTIKKNKTTVIKHKLGSNIKPGLSLCFQALSVNIEGYIGDKKILSTPYKKSLLSCKSSGQRWYFYQLTKDDIGKYIELHVTPYYNDNASYITDISIQNEANFVLKYIFSKSLNIFVSIFLTVFSFIFIFYGIYLKHNQKVANDIFIYLGFFSMLIAVWGFIEIDIISLFIDCSQLLQFLSCNILYLILIPIIIIITNIFNLPNKAHTNYVSLFSLLSYFVSWILHIFNIMDFHESIFICHISIIICIISMIIIIIKERETANDNIIQITFNKKIVQFFSIILIIIGTILDLIVFYTKPNTSNGTFIQIALISIIVYCAIVSLDQIISVYTTLQHNSFVERLAYYDGLTNTKNRTAFIEKIDSLNENLTPTTRLGIVMFDLNDLKIVNDNFGHNEGDRFILDTVELINQTFTQSCELYRIGGDEFCIIIDAPNPEAIYKISLMQLKTHISNFNNFFNKNYKVSLACGAAFYNPKTKENLHELIKIADKNMYEDKNTQKQSINIAKAVSNPSLLN